MYAAVIAQLLASVAPFTFGETAHAAGSVPLANYFESRIRSVEEAVRDGSPEGLGEALRRAQLADFNPEFVADASFGLSGVAQLTVAPELDLVFVPAPPASEKK